jgi:hypothetical protein
MLAAALVISLSVSLGPTTSSATAAPHGVSPSQIRQQCNAFRGAYALGTSIRVNGVTVPACGPRPAFSLLGGLLHAVLPFLGGFASYPGYQCVELSARYLAAAAGVGPPIGIMNGAQVVDSYARRFPKVFVSRMNGARKHPPKRGDVISLANNRRFAGIGHTGVVIASHINRRGNGTIKTMEQNWGGVGGRQGWHVYTVRNWKVKFPLLPWIKWLHRR